MNAKVIPLPGVSWGLLCGDGAALAMDEYREYLVSLGLEPKTVRCYELKLMRVAEWTTDRGLDILDLRPSEVAAVSDLFPRSNSSQRQLRSALTHFWECNGVRGHRRAIRVPPRPKPRWKGLEEAQVHRLLEVSRGDWPQGGVIYLGLYLGLRREEIATLRWQHFDEDLDWVTIVGKQERTRYLPVHPRLQAMLRGARWPGEWVFPGRLGGHVSVTTINNWMLAKGRAAGLAHLHPHQLRHTTGAHINDTARDIHAAQQWLGHARVETTQVYTRVTQQRLIASMSTMDSWEPEAEDAA